MVSLTHFLITRFSVHVGGPRADRSIIRSDYSTINPLAPHRLEKRLKLFELFCLPSVLGQTSRQFSWVLIIDPRLNRRARQRLRDLTRQHRRTFIVEYDPNQEHGRLNWLHPYIDNTGTTHIVTTNVDDDDLLGVGLVGCTRDHLQQLGARDLLPPCKIVACQRPMQWDFMPTRQAHLGYVKPWHRGKYPTFAGYSVCCKQPEYDLSVLAFEHTLGARYFDPATVLSHHTQARIRAAAGRAGDDWRTWIPSRHVHVLQPPNAQVVVVNHLENDQIERLFERWSTRRPVCGPSDFPGMSVAYDKVPTFIRAFGRSPAALARHLYRGLRMIALSHTLKPRERWQILRKFFMFPLWFMTGVPEGPWQTGGTATGAGHQR